MTNSIQTHFATNYNASRHQIQLDSFMNDHIRDTHFSQTRPDVSKSYFNVSEREVKELIRNAWLYGTYCENLSDYKKIVFDYNHSEIVGRKGNTDHETSKVRVVASYNVKAMKAYLKTAHPC